MTILSKVDPLIVFKIALTDPIVNSFRQAVGFPELGFSADSFLNAVNGLPIPIYLNENLSGIVIDSIGNGLDIDTAVEGVNKSTALDVSQRVIDSTLTINMTCNNKDSLVLSAILAFTDTIFRKATSRAYTISFIYGSAVVIDGLLKSFSTNMTADSELVNIVMVISKVNGKSDPILPTITPVIDATPIARAS